MVEEAAELAIEAVRDDRDAAVREAADLVYNLVVLLDGMDIRFDDVCRELERRRSRLRDRREAAEERRRRRRDRELSVDVPTHIQAIARRRPGPGPGAELLARRQRRGDAKADERDPGEPSLEAQKAPVAAEEIAGGAGGQREHPIADDAKPHEGDAENRVSANATRRARDRRIAAGRRGRRSPSSD